MLYDDIQDSNIAVWKVNSNTGGGSFGLFARQSTLSRNRRQIDDIGTVGASPRSIESAIRCICVQVHDQQSLPFVEIDTNCRRLLTMVRLVVCDNTLSLRQFRNKPLLQVLPGPSALALVQHSG